MNKKFISLLFLLCCFSTYSVKAEVPEYSIGVEALPFLPYSDVQEQVYVGFLRKIMDRFAETQNIKFIYKPLPIARLYSDFYNGKIDFKLPANIYWQKDIKDKKKLKIIYSAEVVSFVDGILVKDKSVKVENIKKMGTITGFTLHDEIQKMVKGGLMSLSHNSSLIGLLQQGVLDRVDGVYLNIAVGRYYLKNQLQQDNKLVFNDKLPHIKSSYHLASLKHSGLIENFDKFLKSDDSVLIEIRKEIASILR